MASRRKLMPENVLFSVAADGLPLPYITLIPRGANTVPAESMIWPVPPCFSGRIPNCPPITLPHDGGGIATVWVDVPCDGVLVVVVPTPCAWVVVMPDGACALVQNCPSPDRTNQPRPFAS